MTGLGNVGQVAEATATKGTWLARLTLQGFRNFRHGELECDHRSVVLLGANGGGKTNVLEAISLLVPGRGLRRARLADIAYRGPSNDTSESGQWAVAARVMTPLGPRQLGTGSEPDDGGRERRAVKVDGRYTAGQQALADVLSAVWLTPSMDRLFLEGPATRRRFLDRLVYAFDPAHAGRLTAYEHALRERARLLRAGSHDVAWLAALERTMAEKSVAIAAARRDLVTRLAGFCGEARRPFPQAGLALAGEAESWLEGRPALEVEELLAHRLGDARQLDAQTGGAAVGAHRTDLAVTDLSRSLPAALCSTGEQKVLLVAIILAHARLLALECGSPPLLLLDEVAAHLDARCREALFEEVLSLGGQAWLTGVDAVLFEPLVGATQRFQLREGLVLREA